MTKPAPLTDQQLADHRAIQILSNEGAQCGACGDEPGDRVCPDCEKCRASYVAALRAAGWAPRIEGQGEADDVRQLLVHPAVWPYLETWLAVHGITLSVNHFEGDVLPTYAMTIEPVTCPRCKGTGVDPENASSETYGDGSVRELPEPCSACQIAKEAQR